VPLDRQWIEQHIPHKGRMCLLDEVLSWDATRIRCRSTTHRASDNPLRAQGRLGAACGIEYAAQAMAVHGALIGSSAPLSSTVSSHVRGSIGATVGYLASVRHVTLNVTRLDDLDEELIATAERVAGDGRTVLYEFAVSAGARVLVSGRASIVFDATFGAQPMSTGTHA
jgi:predicted hotdog family 3-hydroxylacyl-ACP dehydratase